MPSSQKFMETGISSPNIKKPTELRVYSRRNKPQTVQAVTPLEHGQSSTSGKNLELIVEESEQESIHKHDQEPEHQNLPSPRELDLPIALRKGIRSCTQHPLANYMTFEKLSGAFRVMTEKSEAEKSLPISKKHLKIQNGGQLFLRR